MAAVQAKAGKWFIRKNDKILGPYPSALLSKFLILGRISEKTLISPDKEHWLPVEKIPSLIPKEMQLSGQEKDQAVKRAKIREDDRTGRDRRDEQDKKAQQDNSKSDSNLEKVRPEGASKEIKLPPKKNIRRAGDRRQQEEEALQKHRDIREALKQEKRSNAPLWLLAIVAVLMMGLYSYSFVTVDPVEQAQNKVIDCSAAAAPQVDWQQCDKNGVYLKTKDLSGGNFRNTLFEQAYLFESRFDNANMGYANLQQANLTAASMVNTNLVGANLSNIQGQELDLRGANLAYANLRDADLTNANIDNANFEYATWIDGRQCWRGSIGGCLLPEKKQ